MTDSFHGQVLPDAVFCIWWVKEMLPLEFSVDFETKPSLPEMNSKAKWIPKPNKLENAECRKWWLQQHFEVWHGDFPWDLSFNFRLLHGCQNYHTRYELSSQLFQSWVWRSSCLWGRYGIVTIHIDGEPSPRGFIWHEGHTSTPRALKYLCGQTGCNCVLRIVWDLNPICQIQDTAVVILSVLQASLAMCILSVSIEAP